VQKSPFAVDDFNFLDAGLALGVRYDWETGVVGPEITAAASELAALQETRRALEERVRHDVLAAHAEWLAAKDKIEATKEGYKATRAWSAFALNGFELGTVTAKELIDGLAAFVKARFALLSFTYEYNVAAARLSETAGQELMPELDPGSHE
jgi:outer membrane protein TolC